MIRLAKTSLLVLAVVAMAVIAACANRSDSEPSYRGAERAYARDIQFGDGDTFRWRNETIRILGIDTPETAHPERGQNEGQPFGDVAADSTRAWMTRAAVLEIVLDGKDRYKRRLAHVFIDGDLLAVKLLEHALAYETVSHFGDSGFPDLAQRILDTSRHSPQPEFEAPYKWKQRQRKKK